MLFTRTASPRTLSLAASLGLPRQRPPGRLKLSRAPANRLAAIRIQGALARPPGLVRRERCASPTSATDSLHEHPADCCVSGRASTPLPTLRRIAMRRAHAHPGPEPSGVRSWGDLAARIPGEPARWSPCLTAKLQLQPSPQPSREPPKGCQKLARELCPERPREGRSAVLVEPRSTAPPRSAFRPRCSRPRSGLATLPLTSLLAILRGPGLSLSGKDRVPIASDRRTPRRRRLVKGRGHSLGQDAFHRRVLPPPIARPAFAFCTWDQKEPATGIAARVLVAFATATRLPAPFRLRRSREREPGS